MRFIGLQRVDDYSAPSWPDENAPQQLQLDFAVDDLDRAETERSAPPTPSSTVPQP